jgi:hypothetical protein
MRGMDPQRRQHVTIDFEPAVEPIQGWLSDGCEPPRFFRGWLELSSALERSRGSTDPVGNEEPATDPDGSS